MAVLAWVPVDHGATCTIREQPGSRLVAVSLGNEVIFGFDSQCRTSSLVPHKSIKTMSYRCGTLEVNKQGLPP